MINRGVDDVAQDLDGMFFQMQPPETGTPAETVIVRFSKGSYNLWEYDPQNGRYLRFQDSISLSDYQEEEYEPLLDRLTDEQLAFDNLVVLYIPHEYFRETPTEIIAIDLLGEGDGYSHGKEDVIEISGIIAVQMDVTRGGGQIQRKTAIGQAEGMRQFSIEIPPGQIGNLSVGGHAGGKDGINAEVQI